MYFIIYLHTCPLKEEPLLWTWILRNFQRSQSIRPPVKASINKLPLFILYMSLPLPIGISLNVPTSEKKILNKNRCMHQLRTRSKHNTPFLCFLQQMVTMCRPRQVCQPIIFPCHFDHCLCLYHTNALEIQFSTSKLCYTKIVAYMCDRCPWNMKAISTRNAILCMCLNRDLHVYMACFYIVPNLKCDTAPPAHLCFVWTPLLHPYSYKWAW